MGDVVRMEKYRFNETEKSLIQSALAVFLAGHPRSGHDKLKAQVANNIMEKLGVR